MSRAAGGVYSLPAGNPVVTSTVISSSWANTTLSDIGTALTDSLSRSGLGGMTAPLLGVDGTAALPALSFSSEPSSGLYRISAGLLGVSVLNRLTMSIAAAGNVVVAVPSSGIAMSITGIAAGSEILKLTDATTSMGFWTAAGPKAQFGTSTNHPLQLVTNSASRGEISTAGNWALPTATSGVLLTLTSTVSGANSLEMTNSTNSATGIRMQSASGTAASANIDLSDGTTTGGMQYHSAGYTGAFPTGTVAGTSLTMFANAGSVQLATNSIVRGLITNPGVCSFWEGTLNVAAAAMMQVATYEIGTFTGTLTGCTTSPTTTINYRRCGPIVTLVCDVGVTGTSNTTSCTLTGLPAALAPAKISTGNGIVTDSGVNELGLLQISAAATVIQLGRSTSSLTGFTAAGVKGTNRWTFTYSIL